MSRGYRIEWKQAERTVRASDELNIDVDLLDILPADEMHQLLQEELVQDGWRREDDALVCDLKGARVELREGRIDVHVDDDVVVTATRASQAEAEDAARSAATHAERALQQKVVKQLTQLDKDIRGVMQDALKRTYRRALEQRARALGDVESIEERVGEDGEVEVTIKVKV